jgi:hypothetical protein
MKFARRIAILVAAIALLAAPATAEIRTIVTATASILSTGETTVSYDILNAGNEEVLHVRVATFLGPIADRSDPLGDNAPGKTVRCTRTLDTRALVPGHYILAARVNFEDRAGATHAVHHFIPLAFGAAAPGVQTASPLTVAVSDAEFNAKSPLNTKDDITLILKNTGGAPLEPVVSFFLPDGVTTAEPEKAYPVAAGETKTVKLPLNFAPTVARDLPYRAVVWYEAQGRHDARLLEGTIRVTQKPVLFKAFLIGAGAVLVIVVASVVVIRRRKQA